MKSLQIFRMVPFIAILFLAGCNNDDNEKEQTNITPISKPKPLEIVLNQKNMMDSLKDFQDIATQNGGHRVVGSPGGRASAEYILAQIDKAGFQKTTTTFINSQRKEGRNILVDIPGQSRESVILIGAHYDSVKEGPGINDNASGVAVVLELMNQLSQAKTQLKYSIRLAFWDAEEGGLAGSSDYVKKLNEAQLKTIKAYINLDMVGTRSATATVLDGDKSSIPQLEEKLRREGKSEEEIRREVESAREGPSHAGDLALENVLKAFYKTQKYQGQPLKTYEDLTVIPTTDIGSFAGKVPVAALEMLDENNGVDKYALCYHRDCDKVDLIDPEILGISGKALVHLIKTLQSQ